MAKISAHGAHKVAEASFDMDRSDYDTHFGSVVRYHYVLTSDGRILSAHSWPQARSSYDRSRSAYTIDAKIKKDFTGNPIEVFTKFVTKRQLRLAGTNLVVK